MKANVRGASFVLTLFLLVAFAVPAGAAAPATGQSAGVAQNGEYVLKEAAAVLSETAEQPEAAEVEAACTALQAAWRSDEVRSSSVTWDSILALYPSMPVRQESFPNFFRHMNWLSYAAAVRTRTGYTVMPFYENGEGIPAEDMHSVRMATGQYAAVFNGDAAHCIALWQIVIEPQSEAEQTSTMSWSEVERAYSYAPSTELARPESSLLWIDFVLQAYVKDSWLCIPFYADGSSISMEDQNYVSIEAGQHMAVFSAITRRCLALTTIVNADGSGGQAVPTPSPEPTPNQSSSPVQPEPDAGGFTYTVLADGTASITGYDANRDTAPLAVPAYVDGHLVTKIGASAFEFSRASSITLPDSIRSIGPQAFMFADCTSINVPDSVTELGREAFACCDALTELYLPDGITELPEQVFDSNDGLRTVRLPAGLAHIASRAFIGCSSLTQVALPNTVATIDRGAFQDCTALRSIDVPGSVAVLSIGAFSGCTGLEQAVLAEGVREIGQSAFEDCSNLRQLSLPASLRQVDLNAFSSCWNLSVQYAGSETQWNQINIRSGNEQLLEAPRSDGASDVEPVPSTEPSASPSPDRPQASAVPSPSQFQPRPSASQPSALPSEATEIGFTSSSGLSIVPASEVGFGVSKPMVRGLHFNLATRTAPTVGTVLSETGSPGSGNYYRIVEVDGDPAAADSPVSTGMKIELVRNSPAAVLASAVIVVPGDVQGTGRLSISQLVILARVVTGAAPLQGYYAAAADFNGTGRTDIGDVIQLASMITDSGRF
ncbi:MAG: leucine-rich repeat protein [Clostridia bacterium]|nr:leucine-rich repeat protein [Clostridia bacterium]